MMKKRQSAVWIAAAFSALALALSGCSSTGEDTAGSGNGESVKIMVFGSFTEPPFALDQVRVAAQAAVEHVNKDGGAGGAQIELIECDDQMNANDAAACARKAVAEDVAAVVGTFSLFGDSMIPSLEEAQIPWVLPIPMTELQGQSEITYAVAASGPNGPVLTHKFKDLGCGSMSVAAPDNPNAKVGWEDFNAPAAEKLGIDGRPVFYPLGETNFSAVAQKLSADTDCIILGGSAPESAAMLTELAKLDVDTVNAGLSSLTAPESMLVQLGEAAEGLIIPSPFFFPATGEPAAVQAAKEMQAIDPDVAVDESALNAYASVLTFAQAAEAVDDDLTGAAIKQALDDPELIIDTGLYPPTSFTENFGWFPPQPRVAGSTFTFYVVENSKFVQDGEPVDFAGQLDYF